METSEEDEELVRPASRIDTGRRTSRSSAPSTTRRSWSRGYSRQTTSSPFGRRPRETVNQRLRRSAQSVRLFFTGQLILDPNESTFLAVWDILIAHIVLFNVISVPWFLALDPSLTLTYLPIDVIILIAMAFDMLFIFRSGFLSGFGQMVFDSHEAAVRYVKSYAFWSDLIALIPIEFIAWALPTSIDGDDRFTADFWYTLIRCKQLLRIHKLLASSRLDSYFQTPRLRVTKIFLAWSLMAHFFACLLVFVGLNQRDGRERNWMIAIGIDIDTEWKSKLYIPALFWSFTTMTSVGYGSIRAQTNVEQSVQLGILIASLVFYTAVFNSIGVAISSFQHQTRHYQSIMDSTKEYAAVNDLPQVLSQKLADYEATRWNQLHGFSTKAILQHVPTSVQTEVLLYINSTLVQRVPFFAQCSGQFLDALILRLKPPAVFLPGDYLFREGDTSRRLYFIRHGAVAVTQENPITQHEESVGAHLTPTSDAPFVGEISLLLGVPRTASVQAVEQTICIYLECDDFYELIALFPEEELSLKHEAIARLQHDYARVQASANKRAGGKGGTNIAARRNAFTPAVTAFGATVMARVLRLEQGKIGAIETSVTRDDDDDDDENDSDSDESPVASPSNDAIGSPQRHTFAFLQANPDAGGRFPTIAPPPTSPDAPLPRHILMPVTTFSSTHEAVSNDDTPKDWLDLAPANDTPTPATATVETLNDLTVRSTEHGIAAPMPISNVTPQPLAPYSTAFDSLPNPASPNAPFDTASLFPIVADDMPGTANLTPPPVRPPPRLATHSSASSISSTSAKPVLSPNRRSQPSTPVASVFLAIDPTAPQASNTGSSIDLASPVSDVIKQRELLRSTLRRSSGGSDVDRTSLLSKLASKSTRELLSDAVARAAAEDAAAAENATSSVTASGAGTPRDATKSRRNTGPRHPSGVHLPLASVPLSTSEPASQPLSSRALESGRSEGRRATLRPDQENELEMLAALRSKRDTYVSRASSRRATGVGAGNILDAVQSQLHPFAQRTMHELDPSQSPVTIGAGGPFSQESPLLISAPSSAQTSPRQSKTVHPQHASAAARRRVHPAPVHHVGAAAGPSAVRKPATAGRRAANARSGTASPQR